MSQVVVHIGHVMFVQYCF